MRTLAISRQFQENHSWCWATVGSIIYKHCKGTHLSQCEIAERVMPGRGCCKTSALCEVPYGLEDLLFELKCLRPGGRRNGPLSLDEVAAEIDTRGRVVAVRLKGGALPDGHFLIVFGYDATSSPGYLAIFDPQFGEALIPIDQFPGRHIAGSQWTHSYLLETAT